jgi:hypothetical protein
MEARIQGQPMLTQLICQFLSKFGLLLPLLLPLRSQLLRQYLMERKLLLADSRSNYRCQVSFHIRAIISLGVL